MTTYDEIWLAFKVNFKTPNIKIPQSDSQIYDAINNGVDLLNNRLRLEIECDNVTETVSEKLNKDHLLILANYIKLVCYKNELSFNETLLNPFQKDIGFRNLSNQIASMKASIQTQEDYIEKLIMNQMDDFL